MSQEVSNGKISRISSPVYEVVDGTLRHPRRVPEAQRCEMIPSFGFAMPPAGTRAETSQRDVGYLGDLRFVSFR